MMLIIIFGLWYYLYIKNRKMNPNYYENQKLRAISRKRELINMMGGQCCMCGYKKNYAALEFHHVNPSEKSFQLDARRLSNTAMDVIMEESKKCILVCSNCHKEIHNPSFNADIVETIDTNKKSLLEPKRKQSICPVCGKNFDFVRGKIYCSSDCRIKDKNYPDRDEVVKKYKELKSQKKVAEYYGLTRKIIIGILKREK